MCSICAEVGIMVVVMLVIMIIMMLMVMVTDLPPKTKTD
jgi:hypothetical protein